MISLPPAIKQLRNYADTLIGGTCLKLLLTFCLILLCQGALAEGGNRKPLSGTIFGGFSIPSNQYQAEGTASGFMGPNFGFGGEIRVANSLGVTLDVLYESKGHITNIAGSETRYNLNYVNLPVQLRWHLAPFLAIHAGPYLASLMVAATRDGNGVTSNVKSDFNNDYGITAGIWFGARANKFLEIGLDTRYDLGLADVQNDNLPATYIRTRSLIFLLTFTFGM